MAGIFDLEKKVTYNELAPSLQAMLNVNEFGIAFILEKRKFQEHLLECLKLLNLVRI